jgi:16S rRNA (guanine527-N7)-methyltransferase
MQAPPEATAVFGAALDRAAAYAELLAGPGVERGLIGPREVDRVWSRHLLNCAAPASLVPEGATVLDVGSGAGLPGIPLALARPDLAVVLLEPLERRTRFLHDCVATLGLAAVRVERRRAEDAAGLIRADAVVARAVAPLDRLLRICWPLVAPGGILLAYKGVGAAREMTDLRLPRDADGAPELLRCGPDPAAPLATVVRLRRRRGGGGSVGHDRSGLAGGPRRTGGRRARLAECEQGRGFT